MQISATEREAVSNDAESNAREVFIPKTLPASCGGYPVPIAIKGNCSFVRHVCSLHPFFGSMSGSSCLCASSSLRGTKVVEVSLVGVA